MIAWPGRFLVSLCFAAALSMLVVDRSAWPQAAPAAPALGVQEQGASPQPPAAQPVAPTAPENPGLINEMGKLFHRILPGSAGQAGDDPNATASETGTGRDAVKDAAIGAGEALSRLARPASMVTGRVICPVAANGTPDCKSGADRLCQTKGFHEGKSLMTDAAESCSPKVLIPGRQRKPDDCRTNNYVTTALCR
jgi:hypothetical protein